MTKFGYVIVFLLTFVAAQPAMSGPAYAGIGTNYSKTIS